jgi:hypothetical protein
MSRIYESAAKKKPPVRCTTCGFTFYDAGRQQCVQCLAVKALKNGGDPAPFLSMATQKERDELHILRPLNSEPHSKDWIDLGDQFFSTAYVDGKGYRSIVSRDVRASRRTKPLAEDRRLTQRMAEMAELRQAWRKREAAFPRAVTAKQRAAMKAHALGKTIPQIAADEGKSVDTIKDRIRRGEALEERERKKNIISSR